jgi:selT/selW/selH-like putative selenoprotein
LAADIENAFGIKPELIKSSGGAFEVRKDGGLIFSKLSSGRFPETEEILEKLK